MKKYSLRRWMAGMLTAALALGALSGCGGGSAGSTDKDPGTEAAAKSGGDPVVIHAYGELDPQVSAQQIIADKKGFFAEEGLTVENKLMNDPSSNASLVASGEAEVSFGSLFNNITVAANGIDADVLAPLANAAATQAVVAGPEVAISSAKDIEGKKIGMTSGAGVLIAVQNMCKDLGVDINKITFVNLGASEQLSALERGDIDLMACWEPWITKAEAIGGKVLFTGSENNLPEKKGPVNWVDFYMTVQANNDFVTKHPEEMTKFLRALGKATDYINNNKAECAEIIAGEIGIDAELCETIMNKNVYSMEFSQQFVDAATNMSKFLVDIGTIQKAPDFAEFSNTAPLSSVDAALVTAKP
ncbi:MAG: ABC transporter substrate-binding protein [Intestinibacillus sp.]